MDGMSGKKTRHFYNNLLQFPNSRYLEIGTWKGSSVCSAMYENSALVVCMDNFSEFNGPRTQFLHNFEKYRGKNNARFIDSDCFSAERHLLPQFNMFLYDGDHTELSHYRALSRFVNQMDTAFVFVVDDWNWKCVQLGTLKAIEDLQLEVLFSKEILSSKSKETDRDTTGWWNGMYVAVLQKSCLAAS